MGTRSTHTVVATTIHRTTLPERRRCPRVPVLRFRCRLLLFIVIFVLFVFRCFVVSRVRLRRGVVLLLVAIPPPLLLLLLLLLVKFVALVVAVIVDRWNGLVRLLVLVVVVIVGTSRRCTRREDDIAGGRGVE